MTRLTGTEEAIPVHILTGFLGSGKTTLLRQILADEAFGDSAILINEFGDAGLDHILVSKIADDIVLLNSGCLCCTLRGELSDALSDLLMKRLDGTIPPFARIIIETTGLAKPALILSTLFADPMISHHFSVGNIVTAVDCLHFTPSIDQLPPEWLEQVVAADKIVLTKTDLVDHNRIINVLQFTSELNTTAQQRLSKDLNIANLFAIDAKSPISVLNSLQFDPPVLQHLPPQQSLSSLIQNPKNTVKEGGNYLIYQKGHLNRTETLRLTEKIPLDWEAFGVWLSMLLHAHGSKLLRVKGLLHIKNNDAPVVIQGVQHVIYPLEHLDSWEEQEPMTDLVFISRGLSSLQIKKSFYAFVLKRELH